MHSRSSQTPPSGMPLLSRGLACHLWPRSSAARLTYYARTTSLSTVNDHEHPANPQTAGPQERTRRTTCCPAQRVPDSCGSRHPRMEHRPLRNLRRTQRRQPAAPAAAPVSGVPVAGRAGRLVALGVLGVADVGVAQHALGALDAVASYTLILAAPVTHRNASPAQAAGASGRGSSAYGRAGHGGHVFQLLDDRSLARIVSTAQAPSRLSSASLNGRRLHSHRAETRGHTLPGNGPARPPRTRRRG